GHCYPHQARRCAEGRGHCRNEPGRVLERERRRDRHHRGLHRGCEVMANVLINAPKTVRKGETIELKALILHPMETGFRPGVDGRLIPRNIIEHFTATWNGVEIFRLKMS